MTTAERLLAVPDERVIRDALQRLVLTHHIELGVVLHDPDVVRRLVAHLGALVDGRTGPLAPLT